MLRPTALLILMLLLVLPVSVEAAASSVEKYFEEGATVLGQVFAPRVHTATRIHSHGELGSRHARLLRNQCDASGHYQFFFASGKMYFLQAWRGKEERNRTMELVKGADPKTFTLLSAAYARDKDHLYVIERFLNEEGRCRYRVSTLEGADLDSFRIHPGSNKFMAADENGRYWFGARI